MYKLYGWLAKSAGSRYLPIDWTMI